jgi:ABC-2 type transport system permease protein
MIRKELRQLFRDPKSKRIVFAAPIIQLLAFGYAVNTDVRNVATVLLDHDRSPESRLLEDALTASGYFRVVEYAADRRELGAALDRGAAVAGVEIPVGFGRDLQGGLSPSVQILVDGTNSNTANVAQGYAASIVGDFGVRYGAGGTLAARPPVDLRVRAWFNPALESRVYNVPAVIGVIVLMMCLLLTAMAVVREREMGTLDQLLVSPLTPGELMLGKTLPVAGVALVQLTLVVTVALLWFQIPFRGSPAALLLAAGIFILAGLSLGLLISTISSTQQEAFLAMFLFFMPAIILSGFLYPIDTMPEVFQQLTLLNPLRHFLEIVRAIFLKGAGLGDLWRQYTVLVAMAVGGLWLAIRRFQASVS